MRCVKFVPALAVLLLSACSFEQGDGYKVGLETVELSIDSTGELISSDSIKIGPPFIKHTWRYKITYMASEGAEVKEGDRILAYDGQEQMRKLQKSNSTLQAEKKKLESENLVSEKAAQDLKLSLSETRMQLKKARRKASQDGDYAAKLDVKRLIVDLKIAEQKLLLEQSRLESKKAESLMQRKITESEIARLSAEVQAHQHALKSLDVTAKKSGVVVYLKDFEGNKFAVGDSVFMSQNVLEIPNLDKMQVKTTIQEHHFSHLELGKEVQVRLDALPDKVFKGRLLQLGKIVRMKAHDDPSMVYDALVELEETDPNIMRPGMAVRLNIVQQKLDDVAAIPKRFVKYEDKQAYVDVQGWFGRHRQDINIAGFLEDRVVVDQGLEGGERLL
ncbi:efflux RND transporter periplasmic adaptor subunit [Pseudoteredinibacter isoporae]|uniref:Multidrug efflux pump subunit AcrA (Membrane-fusion protein) n=1 Tax=Pseudoteredinibacter isoporae TaxID=570281 RepID=A0A7X0JSI5_9GAMM|nr:efflux RND transporter periplasmic adaptor subunit [Pseudoteredinibacter isoporae]MBB6520600.1 multidrug efflux pump subunit AcrA (membrane-fusion protein) [Pseudoteredinibacter isoporae]NHO86167.1 HlyD family efflux transporter periplasmic adaptor subunit [Pseudoteredinibacter isoporae]NIB25382.1 HlyD family efflux transporter periplasmic adaptor subunit [Pseudoteredinibacter isoporae]